MCYEACADVFLVVYAAQHTHAALCVVQGFLKTAMMNYLALLGWNDGSEKEIYTAEELQEAFSIERITKSPAVFDKVKLAWMNGQHLRVLPAEEVCTSPR
jgi:glutamyl/glutaminyl-tRNA synthetase